MGSASTTHVDAHPNSSVAGRTAASPTPSAHPNLGVEESAITPHPDTHTNASVAEATAASPTAQLGSHPDASVAKSASTMPTTPHPNEPSSLQHAPWLAIASLLVVLMCMGASAGIIFASDKQITTPWKVQPAVLLATLSSVANFALGIAFSASVAITWWRSAERGTSLASLHYIWVRGEVPRFFSALAAGSDAREAVLAAAFIAIVQIGSSALLQRAIHTRIETTVTPQTVLLNITPLLPEGWMATLNGSVNSVVGLRAGLATAQAWWRNDTVTSIDAPGYYCNGTCKGTVQGAGISYGCSSTTQQLDLSTGEGTVIFAINATMSHNATDAPVLLLKTLYSSAINDSCIATITIDTCDIQAGVVEYPVTIQNSTVTLNYDELNNVTVLSTYIYPGDLPTAAPYSGAGTLRGLLDFCGFYLYASTAVLDESHYTGGSILADMFFQTDSSSYDNYTFTTCGLQWSSPTDYVLNSIQDFMFRAAILASTSTEIQTFAAQRTSSALVFYSEYSFLAAALVAMLFAILVVLYMLRGWWKFGRTVSLSPLETAMAFCAPMLQRAGLGSTAHEILNGIGRISVLYTDGRIEEQQDEEQGQLPGREGELQARPGQEE
jgi:hypothetical protein